MGSRQDSPQDQDPHRQGLETLPLTYSPLLSSDPPPAWPRPPLPSPPTQPPWPPVCVCHRVSEVAQVAPRPLSREAPAIWVTVPASENKGASGRGRGEKGESMCLTVWRQSMLTSQQLRCTDWLCMSAIPSSQSEEWVGYSPNRLLQLAICGTLENLDCEEDPPDDDHRPGDQE